MLRTVGCTVVLEVQMRVRGGCGMVEKKRAEEGGGTMLSGMHDELRVYNCTIVKA
jgi:hypothetical protein